MDTNIWGFLAVPVGVAICFGPALVVWIRREYFGQSKGNADEESDASLNG